MAKWIDRATALADWLRVPLYVLTGVLGLVLIWVFVLILFWMH